VRRNLHSGVILECGNRSSMRMDTLLYNKVFVEAPPPRDFYFDFLGSASCHFLWSGEATYIQEFG
jgi:hypothetical protein